MKKVFITRPLKAASPFHNFLTMKGFEVYGESLVSFGPLPFNDLPASDWLFFYSKNGVRFFFDQIPKETVEGRKLAAIGQGTADLIARLVRTPDFMGDGDPVHTATAFLEMARGQQVLFLRAKESRRSIQQLLGDKINAHELEVYENLPREDFDLPDFDFLVFTSPLNVEAYFAKKPIKPFQKIVAIGETTATALAGIGIHKMEVADMPNEEKMAEAVWRYGGKR